ncbi:MAG: GNAT family N-acetyltransferase [Burkholderiaceae bacterium]|jgi:acetyltransferase|nr:GNAT family N-acetyltransferase [Burkholderiaceae bacterium]
MTVPPKRADTPRTPHASRYARTWRAADGTQLCIRAIRRGDIALEARFLSGLSREALYQRVLSSRGLLPGELKRLTRIDFAREVALVGTVGGPSDEQAIGVARYVVSDSGAECEFAIIVADAWQRRGAGRQLLGDLIAAARGAGLRRMVGSTLATNEGMKSLARKLGFSLQPDPRDGTVTLMALEL